MVSSVDFRPILPHSNNYHAIQQRLDAGVKTITLTDGEFEVRGSLVARGPVTLQGQGIGDTVLRLGPNTPGALFTSNGYPVRLSNLSFDGNRAQQNPVGLSYALIDVTSAPRAVFNSVEVYDSVGSGILARTCSTVQNIDVRAHHCEYKGLWALASTEVTYNACHAYDNGLDGVDVDGFCHRVTADGLMCYRNGRMGIFIEESTQDMTLNGGNYYLNGQHGIAVNQQLPYASTPEYLRGVRRITIVGPVCRGNTSRGLYIRANNPDTLVEDVTVNGGVYVENGGGGLLLGSNISATCQYVNVFGGRYQSIEVQPAMGTAQIVYPLCDDVVNNSNSVAVYMT